MANSIYKSKKHSKQANHNRVLFRGREILTEKDTQGLTEKQAI